MKDVEKWQHADEEVRKYLPPGVKLVRTLQEHTDVIMGISWSPNGQILASLSAGKIRLWDADTGECLHTLEGQKGDMSGVAFDPEGRILASGSGDGTVKLWDPDSGKLLHTLEGGNSSVNSIAFDPEGRTLASGNRDGTVKLWDLTSGKLLHTLEGSTANLWDPTSGKLRPLATHLPSWNLWNSSINSVAFDPEGRTLASGDSGGTVMLWDLASGKPLHMLKGGDSSVSSVAFDPEGRTLASGNSDGTVKLWDPDSGKLLRTLEGHAFVVMGISFMQIYPFLGSLSIDGSMIIWRTDTWESLVSITGFQWPSLRDILGGLDFHPNLKYLATVGSNFNSMDREKNRVIHIWELDPAVLLGQPAVPTITYTSAKIVLVGDSGVGKTGLGWLLSHGEFKEHSSTHGQQFWLLKPLCIQRDDGAQCEAVLWDLAGQPDYRLIHALFLDDADLALLLFDPTRNDDPLSGVEFWLKQLKAEAQPPNGTPTVLIAARSDRGTPWLTQEELNAFCKQRGIKAYLLTSAKSGEGINELIQQMQNMIPWDAKPATVTTETFKRIKDFVLDIKGNSRRRKVILTPKELRQRLEKTDHKWKFSDTEMMTAVGHLENHGYAKQLKTSQGESRILLSPEILRNS